MSHLSNREVGMVAKNLMFIMDKLPFTVDKISRKNLNKTSDKVVQTVIFIAFLLATGSWILEIGITDLISFVFLAMNYFSSIIGLYFIYHIWFVEQTVSLEDFEEFDAKHEVDCREADAVSTVTWFMVMTTLYVAMIVMASCNYAQIEVFTLYVTWIPVIASVGQVFLFKSLVVKRLDSLASAFGDRHRCLSSLPGLRSVLDLSDRVNEDFSFIFGSVCLANFFNLSLVVASLWSSVVLDQKYFGNPVQTVSNSVLVSAINLLYLAATVVSSGVSSRLDQISHKIDGTISLDFAARDPLRHKLLVIMHELIHTDTDASAMDLFFINTGSVLPFLALILNNLMVFMQYL